MHYIKPKPDLLEKLLVEKVKEHLKQGTQIIYIPLHADGDPNHPDTQEGFVTSVTKNGAFCRYWSTGSHRHYSLRTTANSELTPFDRLIIKNTRPQSWVDELLKQIKEKQ